MNPALMIAVVIIALIIVWAISTYNRMVKGKNLVEEGWSGIDVQLKRRYDLIPNIVETVKGYSKHEKQLFEDIALIRSNIDKANTVNQRGETEIALSKSLRNLFAIAEAYPELKANTGFLDLQKSLSEIEDQISMARRYYNGTVRNMNILVESFPNSLVAGASGFKSEPFFEIEFAIQREAPGVKMDN